MLLHKSKDVEATKAARRGFVALPFFTQTNRFSTIIDKKEMTMNQRTVIDDVREQYADVAKSSLSNDSKAVRSVAAAFGYSQDELASLPEQANMGLSCGNPLALASVSPGEVVVDLGCGGGMDVFLAAQKVGPMGKVIGIDMTSEMLERARAGVAKLGLMNVELHQSTIDRLPIEDNSVDCIISNCVIMVW